jgi:penicillin-binding protein 1C
MVVAVWAGRPDGASSPGLVGREAAGPILFDAFARLGGRPEPITLAAEAGLPETAELPPALRRFQPRGQAAPALAAGEAPLLVAFPPDGARLDLGTATPREAMALKVAGGAPPFTWLVDGRPVAAAERRRQSAWVPPGPGFARLTVIDGAGRSASASVRVE